MDFGIDGSSAHPEMLQEVLTRSIRRVWGMMIMIVSRNVKDAEQV